MSTWILFLALQVAPASPPAPGQPVAAPAASTPAVATVEPWAGSLRAGRSELARLSKRDEPAAAQALAAALLAKPDFDLQPEAERAEVLYAIGVVHGRARAIPEAVESFHRSRGLAGSSELGRAAAYNAGTYLLLGAEALRREIPEIREKLGLPAAPALQGGVASATGAPAGEAPDPLAVAREAYLAARRELVDALRSDVGEGDVRANLELCVRRLRELDELQRQREEQEQQQQQQDSEQDPQRDPEPKDGEQQPKQDPEDAKDPEQQDSRDKPEQEGEPKDEPPKPDPKEDEPEPGREDQAQPDPAQAEEQPLSPEEMLRLLQQLEQIDEKARQVEALLRERRRQPVKKDW